MYLIIIVLSMFLAAACSTQPKNPGVTYSLRRQAETQLNQGNKQADRGELGTALAQLEEAMRLAIATDDPGLRVRAGLSRGNVLFSLGRREEAEEAWNNALDEAESIGGSELIAVSRIHIARGKLLASTGGSPAGVAESVRDEVNRDMALVRSDQFYTAFAWMVIGLAEKELGRYAQAEAALRRSLDIHEKDRNFELAAYDWFMIASFRSLAGDYRGARQALETAISFDRSVENSWGLASDWRALGDVNRKAGDRDAAHAAYLRAAQIFRAMGNGEAAEETLSRSENR
jgi:tetratricopeptide (TPR) repeat protein